MNPGYVGFVFNRFSQTQILLEFLSQCQLYEPTIAFHFFLILKQSCALIYIEIYRQRNQESLFVWTQIV